MALTPRSEVGLGLAISRLRPAFSLPARAGRVVCDAAVPGVPLRDDRVSVLLQLGWRARAAG